MSEIEVCAPGAQLMESMRAVGYSMATALADIVDNSISANAKTLSIYYSVAAENPYIGVLDDGTGMSPEQARIAMQLAGHSATSARSATDLGRFGLGLKTASLSQCRQLTLLSKSGGKITGLVWDLDQIASTNSWSLLVLSQEELMQVPHAQELDSQDSGTLVVWTNLDRFRLDERDLARELDAQMMDAKKHLSLIFHQFLNGDGIFPKVRMSINGVPLAGLDPFLSKASRTQRSPVEEIIVNGTTIDVQAFTLPFLNSMTAHERELAQAAGALRDSQGFYIYRAGRLVIWGTWFKLMPKNDTGKLARVKVNIPNALDHLWSLDIKKSSAVPPTVVRERLRHLAGTMIEPSNKVHSFRGIKQNADDPIVRLWELVEDRDSFRYVINREHPVFAPLIADGSPETLRSLNEALVIIEKTFPINDLFNQMSNDRVPQQSQDDVDSKRGVLRDLWAVRSGKEKLPEFITRMTKIEPWDVFAHEQAELETWILENESEIRQ